MAYCYGRCVKLKEISYIHAESYAASELKHGPLALVDAEMPIIAVAPNDELLEKLKSNLEEVQARGAAELFVLPIKHQVLALLRVCRSSACLMLLMPLHRLFIPYRCSCCLIMLRC